MNDYVYYNLGQIVKEYYQDIEKAKEYYEKAISISYNHLESLFNLGK